MNTFDALVHELNQKIAQLRDWIASGQAHDYSEYQKVCGEIKGLLTAQQYVLDLKLKMEHSDDE